MALGEWSEQPTRDAMADVAEASTAPPVEEPSVTEPETTIAPLTSVPKTRLAPQREEPEEEPEYRPAPPKVMLLVTHNTRIPVHIKEKLMTLAQEVEGENQTTILVRALEREFARMEDARNAKRNKRG